MKLAIVAAVALLTLTGCTGSGVETTLAQQGYTNIHVTGYRFFGCGQDDSFHAGFEATTANGSHVTGVVCSGFLKGKTIRLD